MGLMLYTEAPRSAGAKLSSLEPFGSRDQCGFLGGSPRPSIRLSSVNCKLSYGLITSKQRSNFPRRITSIIGAEDVDVTVLKLNGT